MKKLATFIMAIIAFGLQAQDDNGIFKDWDADGNGYVSNDEFNNGWEEEGVFGDWDRDGDNTISEEEWEGGSEVYYAEAEGREDNDDWDFDLWDENGDGSLDENEFSVGTYSLWDEDDDEMVDVDEHNKYYAAEVDEDAY